MLEVMTISRASSIAGMIERSGEITEDGWLL